MFWLGVHLPCLGLEIYKRRHPAELARPSVLVADNRIRIADSRAQKAGVVVGSTLATAHSVVTDLIHFNRDEAAEIHRLRQLAEMAYRFTSHVSIETPSALLLEIEGSLKLFGGFTGLEQHLVRMFARLEHEAFLGVAHTPNAALALAKARLRAGLSDFPEPEEVERKALRALAPASLACTELEPRVIERLGNMGIFDIGALLRLPTAEIGKRFSTSLLDYLAKLTGRSPDPRLPEIPKERFESSLHLLESISSKETLLFPMRRLTAELTSWLNARQLGATAIEWRFKPLHVEARDVDVRFARPRFDSKSILDISKLTLEGVELPEEVLTVSLCAKTVERPSDADSRPGDLFGARAASGAAPSDLVDQIIARLGPESLQALRTVDEHRPEYAWSPSRPGSLRGNTRPPPSAHASIAPARPTHQSDASACQARRRPMWLFEPPRPVNPGHFEILSGPERIEGGWWEKSLSRDYFVATHRSGACCWLFLDTNGWFLHGYFA